MSNRTIRRAAERKATKAARKAATKAVNAQSATPTTTTAPPVPAELSMAAAAHSPVSLDFTRETSTPPATTAPHDAPEETFAEAVAKSQKALAAMRAKFEKSMSVKDHPDEESSFEKLTRIRAGYEKIIADRQNAESSTNTAASNSTVNPPINPDSTNQTNTPPAATAAPIKAEAEAEYISPAESLARIVAGYENPSAHPEKTEPPADPKHRRTHGFIGLFPMLETENSLDFLTLRDDVISEFQPRTATEWRLAQALMQHFWIMLRADRLQTEALDDPKKLSVYMRYHSTHERSYYRALKELQKLVKERNAAKIGFEQQNAKQEAQDARTRLQNARAESLEIDSHCKQVMAVPMPGMENISFQELTEACSIAIAGLAHRKRNESATAAAAAA